MAVIFSQSSKAEIFMLVTVCGIVTSPVTPPAQHITSVLFLSYKIPFSIVKLGLASDTVKLSAVRLIQLTKALSSIFVTLSGIDIAVRALQSSKADLPILSTPLGDCYSG